MNDFRNTHLFVTRDQLLTEAQRGAGEILDDQARSLTRILGEATEARKKIDSNRGLNEEGRRTQKREAAEKYRRQIVAANLKGEDDLSKRITNNRDQALLGAVNPIHLLGTVAADERLTGFSQMVHAHRVGMVQEYIARSLKDGKSKDFLLLPDRLRAAAADGDVHVVYAVQTLTSLLKANLKLEDGELQEILWRSKHPERFATVEALEAVESNYASNARRAVDALKKDFGLPGLGVKDPIKNQAHPADVPDIKPAANLEYVTR